MQKGLFCAIFGLLYAFLGMFSTIEAGREESVKFYNDWVEEVKRTVPQDKLLVFSVKEGWEPLCKFLNVPIPDQPFPRSNDTKSLTGLIRSSRIRSYLALFAFFAPFLGIAVYFRQSWLNRFLK